jgi:hypothetical protein
MNVRFKDYLQDGKEVIMNSNDIMTITGDEDNYILIEDTSENMYKAMVIEWIDNVDNGGWKHNRSN